MLQAIVSINIESYLDADPLMSYVKENSGTVSIIQHLLKAIGRDYADTDDIFQMMSQGRCPPDNQNEHHMNKDDDEKEDEEAYMNI